MVAIMSTCSTNYCYANTKSTLQPIPKQILSDYVNQVKYVQENVNFVGKNAMSVRETNNTNGIEEYLKATKKLQDESIYVIKNIQRDYDNYKNSENSSILLALSLSLTEYRLALQELEFYLKAENIDRRYDAFTRFSVLKFRGDNIIEDVDKFTK